MPLLETCAEMLTAAGIVAAPRACTRTARRIYIIYCRPVKCTSSEGGDRNTATAECEYIYASGTPTRVLIDQRGRHAHNGARTSQSDARRRAKSGRSVATCHMPAARLAGRKLSFATLARPLPLCLGRREPGSLFTCALRRSRHQLTHLVSSDRRRGRFSKAMLWNVEEAGIDVTSFPFNALQRRKTSKQKCDWETVRAADCILQMHQEKPFTFVNGRATLEMPVADGPFTLLYSSSTSDKRRRGGASNFIKLDHQGSGKFDQMSDAQGKPAFDDQGCARKYFQAHALLICRVPALTWQAQAGNLCKPHGQRRAAQKVLWPDV